MNTAKFPTKTIQALNIVTFLATFGINALSNILPLNGVTVGEISDRLPSFFTPAGYTFAIWGVIYAALFGFIIYQALPIEQNKRFLRTIGWAFVASNLFNSAWIFAWHYGFYVPSIFIMLGLLVSLIVIFNRLNIGRPDRSLPWTAKLLVHVPFAIYLGWITVATIANIASVTNYLGWNGFGIAEPTWSATMMLVAVAVAGLLLFNRTAIPYAAVLVWALFGIRAAHIDVPLVASTAVLAATLITILALVGAFRVWRQGREFAQSPRPRTA